MADARQVGARVEELLGVLQAEGGQATAQAAEELVRLLLGLYGDGLRHIMSALRAEGEAGAAILDRLLADPLVESLLLLHDLHPLDVDARIQRALDQVRPYLGSHAGGVQYLGVTDEGVARLRLEGSCHGCPSSTVTVQLALKGAVEDAAPEVTEVVVEGMTSAGAAPLLQIGSRPPGPGSGTDPAGPPGELAGRRHLGHPAGHRAAQQQAGRHRSRPGCRCWSARSAAPCTPTGTPARCAPDSLADGTLTVGELACAGCGTRYDVRAAGRSTGDPAAHLDPLPLLADSQGVRVAVAARGRRSRS